jgi:ParB-like chromosome segregation protein Spo0J
MVDSTIATLDRIVLDERVWPRERLDAGRVDLFAELIDEARAAAQTDGGGWTYPFPPLVTVADGNGGLVLADGRHRLAAVQRVGINTIPAIEHPYDGRNAVEQAYALALKYAIESPVPLTERERRRALVRELRDRPALSDREIGRRVGVSHQTVGVWRKQLASGAGDDEQIITRQPRRSPAESIGAALASLCKRLAAIEDDGYDELMEIALVHATGGNLDELETLGSVIDDLVRSARTRAPEQ